MNAYPVASLIYETSESIISLGERFRAIPEPGFRELRTAALAAEFLQDAGADVETGLAITGVRGSVGPVGAPELILVADMDGLMTNGSPGGMMHSCGHGAQMSDSFPRSTR